MLELRLIDYRKTNDVPKSKFAGGDVKSFRKVKWLKQVPNFRFALRELVDGIIRLPNIEPEFSDKFGHGNCVTLRDSAKW
jgi:hypothetical protein